MFTCMFPDCTYHTRDRSLIDLHHIKPKELDGSDIATNRMQLCPIHHRMIYVPDAKFGHHSIKGNGYITVLGFFNSTAGIVLHFLDCDSEQEYFYMYSKSLKSLCN